MPFLLGVGNSYLQPPPDGPATASNIYLLSMKNTLNIKPLEALKTLKCVTKVLIDYSLMVMLNSHVVVQSMCFVPDDVKGKSLQTSTLQRERTQRSIHQMIALSTHMQRLHFSGISPVDDEDDVDLQSCFFRTLLCTAPHLCDGLRNQTTVLIIRSSYCPSLVAP